MTESKQEPAMENGEKEEDESGMPDVIRRSDYGLRVTGSSEFVDKILKT